MKKLLFISTIVSFICIYGCQNDTIFNQTNVSESNEPNSLELTDSEISILVNHYFQRLQQNIPTTKSLEKPQINAIKKKHYTPIITKSGNFQKVDFTLCNIDFQNDGFAIVLADRRLPLVLAYSPYGNSSKIENSENPMLTQYVESLPHSIGQVLSSKNYDSYYPDPNHKYNTFPYPRISDDYCTWIDEKGCYNDVVYLEETTLWGQDDPYNKYMPLKSDSINNQLVGCVAISLTNVMSYFKHPQTYNWKIMTAVQNVRYNSFAPRGAADTIALFLKEVATILRTQYKDSVSTSTPEDCINALKYYNYSYDPIQDYNLDAIMTSIKKKSPVIAFGGKQGSTTGHAVVFRGYWEVKVTSEMKNITTDDHLYDDGISLGVTWGNAGGWGDGWYLVQWGDLNISDLGLSKYNSYPPSYGDNYNKNLRIITNIAPIK